MVVREQWFKLRDRVAAHGLGRTAQYLMFTVLVERAGLAVNAAFEFEMGEGAAALPGCEFVVVHDFDGFREDDLEHLREYGGDALIEKFGRGFANHELCVVARVDDHLATVCWVVPERGFCASPTEPSVTVERCFTLPAYRGRGLFPAALDFIRGHLSETRQTHVYIEASIFNTASLHGIVKSGGRRVGTKVSYRGREAFILNGPPRNHHQRN